jgi:gamma-glutamylcysteine synthetase
MSQLRMKIWVEIVGADGVPQRREIALVERIVDGARLDDFGLSLEECELWRNVGDDGLRKAAYRGGC